MSAVERFAIQRNDAAWFAGRSEDGSPVWTTERRERYVFENESEAWSALQQLQRAGHQVQLFGLMRE